MENIIKTSGDNGLRITLARDDDGYIVYDEGYYTMGRSRRFNKDELEEATEFYNHHEVKIESLLKPKTKTIEDWD
jgi:hypothetical protein